MTTKSHICTTSKYYIYISWTYYRGVLHDEDVRNAVRYARYTNSYLIPDSRIDTQAEKWVVCNEFFYELLSSEAYWPPNCGFRKGGNSRGFLSRFPPNFSSISFLSIKHSTRQAKISCSASRRLGTSPTHPPYQATPCTVIMDTALAPLC